MTFQKGQIVEVIDPRSYWLGQKGVVTYLIPATDEVAVLLPGRFVSIPFEAEELRLAEKSVEYAISPNGLTVCPFCNHELPKAMTVDQVREKLDLPAVHTAIYFCAYCKHDTWVQTTKPILESWPCVKCCAPAVLSETRTGFAMPPGVVAEGEGNVEQLVKVIKEAAARAQRIEHEKQETWRDREPLL